MIVAGIVAVVAITAYWFLVHPKLKKAKADAAQLATLQAAQKTYDADVLAFNARKIWEQAVRVATGVAK